MADALKIVVGGVEMPGGVVALKRSDELLWSEGTGRAATSGLMAGSVVAKKQTWSIQWGIVPKADYDRIKAIPGGFVSLVVQSNGATLANITAYRSNVGGEFLGVFGGVAYWKGVTVDLIER